jgi:hypothetical protein
VEAQRDGLRLATLGWIVLSFEVLPDPSQGSDALIACSRTDATVLDTSTIFVLT